LVVLDPLERGDGLAQRETDDPGTRRHGHGLEGRVLLRVLLPRAREAVVVVGGPFRQRPAGLEEGADAAQGRVARVGDDAVDGRVLGEQPGHDLLHLGGVPVGVDRLARLVQELDVRAVGVLLELLPDADHLGDALRVARGAAEEDDVAAPLAERLAHPAGPGHPVVAGVVAAERGVVLAGLAAGVRRPRHHLHARLVRLTQRRQQRLARVGEDHEGVHTLRDQGLDVTDRLLRVVLAVGVGQHGDVRALARLVLELGAGRLAEGVVASAVRERDLHRLGAAEVGHGTELGNVTDLGFVVVDGLDSTRGATFRRARPAGAGRHTEGEGQERGRAAGPEPGSGGLHGGSPVWGLLIGRASGGGASPRGGHAGSGARDLSRVRSEPQDTPRATTLSARTTAWTSSWVAVDAPAARTTWSSWVRKSAATAVAARLVMPPDSRLPPSTTAAMVGSR